MREGEGKEGGEREEGEEECGGSGESELQLWEHKVFSTAASRFLSSCRQCCVHFSCSTFHASVPNSFQTQSPYFFSSVI